MHRSFEAGWKAAIAEVERRFREEAERMRASADRSIVGVAAADHLGRVADSVASFSYVRRKSTDAGVDAVLQAEETCPADPDGCTPETCTRNDCGACGAASNPADRACFRCGAALAGAPCVRGLR